MQSYAEHMSAMDSLSCPFCPFSDPSPYFLAQHVETIHPEDDEPSFLARHLLDVDDSKDASREAIATGQDAPSHDYIECECGEAVLLSEFDDHVQLHSAESADMAVDTTLLPGRATSSRPHDGLSLPPTASPLRLLDLNSLLETNNATSPPNHYYETKCPKPGQGPIGDSHKRHHHTVKEWIDLLLGSDASRSRPKTDTTKHKNAKRLGVSKNSCCLQRWCRLIDWAESRARSLCPRGADASMVI